MKFKIDENLPTELAEMLNDAGHDASTVYLQKLDGEPDNVISEVCQMEERAIVTLDIGFSNIQTYPPAEFSGIIVLRLVRQDKHHVVEVFERLIPMLLEEDLAGKLWIVDEYRVRIRE
ncbi:MAG: DUF5615 family PIN-like protein [Saprospiraceae bacterium]|jgi:predicted nuclease of predicted toxin-antitoxin system|nr:DUF5615 family PIN-like protein [Saprospiraceae bacterium]